MTPAGIEGTRAAARKEDLMVKGTKKARGGSSTGVLEPGTYVPEVPGPGPSPIVHARSFAGVAIERVGLEWLREHPENPRVRDEADVASLAASIEAQGQLQPILARRDGLMLSGHRRKWALELLGRAEADVVLLDCSDEEARALLVASNAHVTVDPIAEALVVDRLLEDGKRSVRDVAHALGWSVGRVAARRELLQLSGDARVAARSGGSITHWTVRMLEALATLPMELQDSIVGGSGEGPAAYAAAAEELPPVEEIREEEFLEFVARHRRSFLEAPFDPRDAELVPAAGACFGAGACCPKSSLARPGLFETEVEGNPETGRCLDTGCWIGKVRESARRSVAELRAKSPALVVVSDHLSAAAAVADGGPVLEGWRAREVKKSTPGAVPAARLTATGEVRKVYLAPESLPAEKPAKPRAADKSQAERLRDSRDAVYRRRLAFLVDEVLAAAQGIVESKTTPSVEVLHQLVAVLELSHPINEAGYPAPVWPDRTRAERLARAAQTSGEGYYLGLWRRVSRSLLQSLRRSGDAARSAEEHDWALWIGGLLGVPTQEIARRATFEVPDPKWWPRGTSAGPIGESPAAARAKSKPARGRAAAAGDDEVAS